MSCTEIQPELVSFCFGEVEGGARERVERHLLDCRECLAEYLEIKRAIETPTIERPSEAAAERLRRSVAVEVGAELPDPRWSWWERPAAFAVAAAMVAAALLFTQAVAAGPGEMPSSPRDQVEQPR